MTLVRDSFFVHICAKCPHLAPSRTPDGSQ